LRRQAADHQLAQDGRLDGLMRPVSDLELQPPLRCAGLELPDAPLDGIAEFQGRACKGNLCR